MKNIIHFIKYNNFFTLAVAITLIGTGSAFAASPELRQTADNALVGKTETVSAVDNTALLNLDANAFNPQITITATTEDTDSYYISYSFHTFEVSNGAWGNTEKTGNLAIPKNALGSVTLREYAEKQLREVAQKEIAFLKEAKASEEKKGEQKTTVVVAYTGLLGLIIDPVEKQSESLVIDTPVAFSAPLVETFVVPQETVPAVSGPEPVVQSVVEEAVSSN
ncbi:MAG: hypothetical protein NT098_00995, partial [Candidatus Parcubacteria bacterium]|nr:hypothetical protein [Candidatus Parcubacteria bacterium]